LPEALPCSKSRFTSHLKDLVRNRIRWSELPHIIGALQKTIAQLS
jgi:hypothetical protein